MLDHEKITITASSLTIEKSGLWVIHLSRQFSMNGSVYIHPMIMNRQNVIALSPSRFLARIGQTVMGRSWLFTSPVRWFCRGLPEEELASIFARIKGKFPDIKILMIDDPLVGPG